MNELQGKLSETIGYVFNLSPLQIKSGGSYKTLARGEAVKPRTLKDLLTRANSIWADRTECCILLAEVVLNARIYQPTQGQINRYGVRSGSDFDKLHDVAANIFQISQEPGPLLNDLFRRQLKLPQILLAGKMSKSVYYHRLQHNSFPSDTFWSLLVASNLKDSDEEPLARFLWMLIFLGNLEPPSFEDLRGFDPIQHERLCSVLVFLKEFPRHRDFLLSNKVARIRA